MNFKKKLILGLGGSNIIFIGLVSLLNDFSSEMILPILPLFIAYLGGTGIAVGVIGGFIEGLPNLIKVVVGYFSDEIHKRKRFIFFGYLLSQIFKFCLIFATGWKMIFAFTSGDKLGKGIREAPRDALIAESIPEKKGKGFGVQRAFDKTGAILGSITVLMLVFFLGERFNFEKVILIAAIIGLTSLIPIFFIRDKAKTLRIAHQHSVKEALGKIPRKLFSFIIIASIFALANFSYMFFILQTLNLFSIDFSIKNSLIITLGLYVLYNLFYAIMAIPSGNYTDSHGRRKLLMAGYFLFSLICVGIFLFSSLEFYIFIFILYGISQAMIIGNQIAFVSDIADDEYKATSIGLFMTLTGLMSIIGNIFAGYLWDIEPSFAFIYGGLIAGISGILLVIHRMIYSHTRLLKK